MCFCVYVCLCICVCVFLCVFVSVGVHMIACVCVYVGARCSSEVRAFAHGDMGRRIDPS